MRRALRLTRRQVIAGLRAHAAAHGFVTLASLERHDRALRRSVSLHFPGIEAARVAAGVREAPFTKRAKKTGPKAGTPPPNRGRAHWTRERIREELRRLHSEGHSLRYGVLISSGHGTLVRTAQKLFGGLHRARESAGIDAVERVQVRKSTWTEDRIVAQIEERKRAGQSLEASRVPFPLYSAARRRFGSWRGALARCGVEYRTLRKPTKHTREAIILALREAARSGADLRAKSLATLVNMRAVTREFGSLRNALRSVGIDDYLVKRSHGGQKWSRARVIDALHARSRGTETPGLEKAMVKYFGSRAAALRAAGITKPSNGDK